MSRFVLFVIFSSALIAEAQESASQSNQVPNAGFEMGEEKSPSEWSFYSWKESEGSWDGNVSHGGKRSALMHGMNGGWSAHVPVSPGKLHRVRFHYRAEGGPSRIILYLRKIQDSGETKVVLYKPLSTIGADTQGGFNEGQFDAGADEKGWVLFDGGHFVPEEGMTSVSMLIKLVSKNADAKVWLDDVEVAAVEKPHVPDTARILRSVPGALIWTENENRKILPEQEPPDSEETADQIQLAIARGEYGSFQIAVTPDFGWRDVSWEWKDFSGDGQLAASALKCRLVETVPIEETMGPFSHQGLNPDPLTERIPCELPEGKNQAFWFTVFAPPGQTPGNYRNELVLSSERREICRVPLELQVRDFSLPRRPTLDVYSGFRSSLVTARETETEEEILKRYYRNYYEHRTRCAPGVSVGVRLKSDRVEVDADAFIEHLRYLHDELGATRYFLPGVWIGHRGTHRIPADARWKGRRIFANAALTELDPAFETPFRDFMGQLISRLKAEDLFLTPTVRFFDEPNLEDPATVNGLRTLAELMRDIDPKLTVSLTATYPHPELTGAIKQWTLHTDAWDRELTHIDAARKAGCRISVYNNAVNYPEHHPLRIRLWPWLLKKYDVDGTNSWWGTVSWRNTMVDPWTSGKGSSGVLLYPPRTEEERGPIDSVRWELFRQGLQDYEYLQLAEDLAGQLEKAGNAEDAQPGRNAIAAALDLVERWPNVRAANDEPYTLDVTAVAAAREKLAEAIEMMQDALKQ